MKKIVLKIIFTPEKWVKFCKRLERHKYCVVRFIVDVFLIPADICIVRLSQKKISKKSLLSCFLCLERFNEYIRVSKLFNRNTHTTWVDKIAVREKNGIKFYMKF